MTVAGKVVSSSIPAVPSTINIMEHTTNNQQKQEENHHAQHLEAFASYCRIFYLSSLRSTDADDASVSMDEARAVLQVFDDLCSGQHQASTINNTGVDVNVRYQDAICKCNLMSCSNTSDSDGAWMMEYIRIRDRERSAAHKIQMLERQSMLSNFLAETSTSAVREQEQQQQPQQQQNALEEMNKLPELTMTSRETIRTVTRAIREFVASYQANIGAHPLIAGIKTVLERQIINEQYRLRWTINGCTLTENCQSGGDSGDMRYMKESVQILRLFLDLVDYNEVASDDVEKDIVRDDSGGLAVDEVVMCFQMKDGISNDTLKHLLSVLPDQRKLDARPTGSLATSNVPRTNSGGEMDEPITFLSWCFDNCVIS
mmetsp:Transcript_8582/g.12680  ORF Transcript_8582/g.12680 Transcript_8582/m.12680 type:complete len:372 (-) Transcript_8582:50-1165(-)